MAQSRCVLIGAPVDSGKRRRGCVMGPDAYRIAGLPQALADLGITVADMGNIVPTKGPVVTARGDLHALGETIAWCEALKSAGAKAIRTGVPVFLGGDHAMSFGTVAGVAAHAFAQGRPQFVLWLDAHSDFHTPLTSPSGNMHGMPLGYLTGRDGFDGFPPLDAPIPEENVCIIGLRSVDSEERDALQRTRIGLHDMRSIDENGIAPALRAFLARVAAAGGALHVSLDVDFLDPGVASAVGTTVPGGATVREAHLVMEMISDSGLMTSLDLAELNPFLDERGRTAMLMVDLAASAFGRRVFDRPTRHAA